MFNQLGDVERCALRPGNVHSADGWRAVLEPVVARYRGSIKRLYFRGDAAFANPEIYEFLEAEGIGYTIRLPANSVLQGRIGYLLKRPVGRPPHEVRRYYASFGYQAHSWQKPRRVVAKVEWHPGELYPRVGFIVTNLARLAERVVAFCNQHGRAEQWIEEGKGAIKWTRLSCRSFAANAVRLQLHALVLRDNQGARPYCLTGGCSRTTDSLPHHLCSHCLSARRLGILPFPLSHACLPWRDLWSCGRRASVVQAERQIHRALLARCVTA